jgi:predicted TIM-barrel fold metal-dependent hydrolase
VSTPDWKALAELRLADWRPRSMMRADRTEVPAAAVPAVDAHNHLGRWLSSDGDWLVRDVDALVAVMDACAVETVVNLDGMWDAELAANLDRYDRAHPGRFLTFCQLEWARLAEPDGVDALLRSLADSAAQGARGVKVWKNLGLEFRDRDGRLITVDDPRVITVLRRAGELDLPVLIHSADPIAFFEPADERNERIEELGGHPDWWFGDRSRHPSFDEVLDAHAALVLACPGTNFIGAHAGCAAEDLDRVERLLAAAPNYTIDIAGRMAELGRQPRRFGQLIERFGDRVLFGTDCFPPDAEAFGQYFRFLESSDEGFDYDPGSDVGSQGRWTVSGLGLVPEQLVAVYRDNARRVLGL